MPRPKIATLLEAVREEFDKGLIFEGPIVGIKAHVEGLCNWESGKIVVNPAPSVVDTLFHELLHRRFPKWGEERVRVETWRIMNQLSQAEVRSWYRKYQRRKTKKRKPVRTAA